MSNSADSTVTGNSSFQLGTADGGATRKIVTDGFTTAQKYAKDAFDSANSYLKELDAIVSILTAVPAGEGTPKIDPATGRTAATTSTTPSTTDTTKKSGSATLNITPIAPIDALLAQFTFTPQVIKADDVKLPKDLLDFTESKYEPLSVDLNKDLTKVTDNIEFTPGKYDATGDQSLETALKAVDDYLKDVNTVEPKDTVPDDQAFVPKFTGFAPSPVRVVSAALPPQQAFTWAPATPATTPAVATQPALTLADFSALSITPVDVAALPVFTPPAAPVFPSALTNGPPTPAINFTDQDRSSTLLTNLQTYINQWVAGAATGIAPVVEAALWERGRAREVATAAKKTQEALRQFSLRGFSKPPGALAVQMMDAEQELQDAVITQSRDVAIKQADLEQSNRRFAFDMAWKIEDGLIQYLNDKMKRAYDLAKAVQELIMQGYAHSTAFAGAQVQAFAASTSAAATTFSATAAATAHGYAARVGAIAQAGSSLLAAQAHAYGSQVTAVAHDHASVVTANAHQFAAATSAQAQQFAATLTANAHVHGAEVSAQASTFSATVAANSQQSIADLNAQVRVQEVLSTATTQQAVASIQGQAHVTGAATAANASVQVAHVSKDTAKWTVQAQLHTAQLTAKEHVVTARMAAQAQVAAADIAASASTAHAKAQVFSAWGSSYIQGKAQVTAADASARASLEHTHATTLATLAQTQAQITGANLSAAASFAHAQASVIAASKQLSMETLKTNLLATVEAAKLAVEQTRAAAQVAAQLAAAALSSVNLSAGTHDSAAWATSVQDSRSRSYQATIADTADDRTGNTTSTNTNYNHNTS